jgi:hypothetical protein
MEPECEEPKFSKEKIQEFIGKIITDEKYRERVFKDPKKTAQEMGIYLNDKQVEIFKSVSPEILREAELFKGSTVGVWVLIPIADVGVAGGTYAVGRVDDDITSIK